ncbi:Uncharacterized protein OS=Sorangium cellulosum (strain So ce56) GN=sce5710 PE=4 SV=1 [Gemmata massiliana]|uniref:SMI1/KNR4 family protein n=1 Tax=Gemmata massiliana TaxID=1210884 RepID=A0A6P2D9R7_9BACT|nr:hypothetical protein [Gemmata massiliana]VTR96252.1 Uncharacterized protein OS=Sorangium cellulosum (strain So ce56) GN=sce5710 PE=4 SV=1 [Gemmata massiliana]
MTEAQWLDSAHPEMMLRYIQRVVPNDRTWRIFAVRCCERVRHLLPDERCRDALDTCARFTEGSASASDLAAAEDASNAAFTEFDDSLRETAAAAIHAACLPNDMHLYAPCATRQAALLVWPRLQRKLEYRWQASVLRDLFGNPFRPVSFSPDYRTSTAVALAAQMYEARDFSAMPILADALQDAGCDSADMLDHCRGPGPHVRGCWVVDQVLGRG